MHLLGGTAGNRTSQGKRLDVELVGRWEFPAEDYNVDIEESVRKFKLAAPAKEGKRP